MAMNFIIRSLFASRFKLPVKIGNNYRYLTINLFDLINELLGYDSL